MSEEDTKVASIFDKDIENFGKDLDKMIEHLNIVIATHNKQVEEIERLNNIINELEKWLEEDESKAMITFETGRCFNYHDIINKIEILKRSDKE